MHRNTVAFVIVAAIGGFIVGFWLANSINRSAITTAGVPAERNDNANATVLQNQSEPDLTSDEIRAKIAEADKNPTNFAFQKDLGGALYRYAAMKQDTGLLTEAVRILERAGSLNAKDFDVTVALGNTYFDIGFFNKDAVSFGRAREIYSKALDLKPGDADVQTDLGLTYFLQDPPAYDKAVTELTKVTDADPKHERSLQFLVQVYVKQDKLPEAEKELSRIKAINPSNSFIAELTAQIANARNAGIK